MGIASIVAGVLKKVPWTSLVMNYGPELVRRVGGKAMTRDVESVEKDDYAEAEAKIRELEAVCSEQIQTIQAQQDQLEMLGETCSALRSQVRLYQGISVAAGIVVIVLGIVLAMKF